MLQQFSESTAKRIALDAKREPGSGGGSTRWYGLGLDDREGHDRVIQGSRTQAPTECARSYGRGRHIEDRFAGAKAPSRNNADSDRARKDYKAAAEARRFELWGVGGAAVERGPQTRQDISESGRITRQVLIQGQGTEGQTLYICIGIPGSGKSTWAKAQTANCDHLVHPIVRINKDELRAMLYVREWNPSLENLTNDIESRAIARALNLGYDVIDDSTNLSVKRINFLQQTIGRNGVTVELVWFDTPFSTCYLRNSRREGIERVPNNRMITFKSRYADMLRAYRSP